jgi:hypothetical protein
MEFLEKQFNEQLVVEVDPLNNVVVIGNLSFSPVDILRLEIEPGLYNTAFQEWLNEQWLPPIEKRAAEIISKHSNRNRFAELLEAISNEKVIPFVGSGMSEPTGFPVWREFLFALCARSSLTRERLDCLLDAGEFELGASEIYSQMNHRLFDERIENTFKVVSEDEINGSVRYLPKIFKKDVITLNYDSILETIYASSGSSFTRILAGENLADFREISSKGGRCLIKYHGDLAEPRTRILTLEEYVERYEKPSEIKDSLVELFKNHKLLFLGCSLSTDRTMELFKIIADSDKKTPRHFALLKAPTEERKQIDREKFLTERSIFPIWYDGEHDECIEAILVRILRETGKLVID